MAEHTIKAFDEEIDRLRGLIAEMGGRAEAAIENAMLALQRQDKVLAAQVVEGDKRIDAIEAEVEKLVRALVPTVLAELAPKPLPVAKPGLWERVLLVFGL